MDDTDFSGVAYISNKGVYLVDESDMPVNLINTGHVDMGIRDVFSTSRGIITQLNAGSL